MNIEGAFSLIDQGFSIFITYHDAPRIQAHIKKTHAICLNAAYANYIATYFEFAANTKREPNAIFHNMSEHIRNRIRNTEILMISNIQQLSTHMLYIIDTLFRLIKKPEPFGGMQYIFVGDFDAYGAKKEMIYQTQLLNLKPIMWHITRHPDPRIDNILESISTHVMGSPLPDHVARALAAECNKYTFDQADYEEIYDSAPNTMDLEMLRCEPTHILPYPIAQINELNYTRIRDIDQPIEYIPQITCDGEEASQINLKKLTSMLPIDILYLTKYCQVIFLLTNDIVSAGDKGVIVELDKDHIRIFTEGARIITINRTTFNVYTKGKIIGVKQFPIAVSYYWSHKTDIRIDHTKIELTYNESGVAYNMLAACKSLQNTHLSYDEASIGCTNSGMIR